MNEVDTGVAGGSRGAHERMSCSSRTTSVRTTLMSPRARPRSAAERSFGPGLLNVRPRPMRARVVAAFAAPHPSSQLRVCLRTAGSPRQARGGSLVGTSAVGSALPSATRVPGRSVATTGRPALIGSMTPRGINSRCEQKRASVAGVQEPAHVVDLAEKADASRGDPGHRRAP